MPSFGSTLSPAQIQTLAAWIASSAGRTASAGAVSSVSGLSGRVVTTLQRQLRQLGYFHGPITGYYGPLTTTAVKRFQRAAGLRSDGVWGPKSQAALRKRLR
jgi:peptidoglycan hydrolase-like protein with peptidoglycan-binding domain